MHCDCWHTTWSVVVSLTSHEQKKEAISLGHEYFFKREVDKIGVISVNITTHVLQVSGTGPADPAIARPMFAV